MRILLQHKYILNLFDFYKKQNEIFIEIYENIDIEMNQLKFLLALVYVRLAKIDV